MINVFEHSS